VTPSAKREAIRIMTEEKGLTVTRACSAARLSRAAFYRAGVDRAERDRPIVDALNEIVAVELRWGFWKCHRRLRQKGQGWNHKRVYRVYCAMNLNQKRRAKRRVPTRERQSMVVVARPNAVWAIDFMHDRLYDSRPFRTLNVLDEAHRGGLGIEAAVSIPAVRVVRFLDQLIDLHGKPNAIRCDNGPELTSQTFMDWCQQRDIEIRYIQPGKPDQNAFIERFNRTYREEVLNAYLFHSIVEVQEITDAWLERYNEIRPHDALGSLPPARYLEQLLAA
jgi:putative transposase